MRGGEEVMEEGKKGGVDFAQQGKTKQYRRPKDKRKTNNKT
jgi:hypothetical protein